MVLILNSYSENVEHAIWKTVISKNKSSWLTYVRLVFLVEEEEESPGHALQVVHAEYHPAPHRLTTQK